MGTVFIETPVRVDVAGDARQGDGQSPAIVLLDAADRVVARFPTPDAPGGQPRLDTVMYAGALDLGRQLNEIHDALLSEAGSLPASWRPGVQAVRFGDSIGSWEAAISVRTEAGGEIRRATAPVTVGNFDRLGEVARRVLAQLRPARPAGYGGA